jgi:multiple sugar transport system permease protein
MKLKLIVRTVLLWLLAAVVLMPLVMTLSGSLMGKTELIDNIGPVLSDGKGSVGMPIFPGMPTLKQYLQLLLDTPKFLDMFWNSVMLVVPILIGQVLVGTLAAWGFARYRFPFKEGLFMLYIALMMMPFQVTLVPTNLVLDALHLLDSRWALILPAVFNTIAVFLLRQFFESVPRAMNEAAEMDGAGEWMVFWKVALPIAVPGIVSLVVLQFFENWNLVEPGLIFLRDKQKWPLSLYLTTIGQSNVDVAMASSIITILPAILIFLYGETYLLQGIRVSGLKE